MASVQLAYEFHQQVSEFSPLHMSVEHKLFNCIISARSLIFGFWIALAAGLAYFAVFYQSKTSMYFAAPEGSPSYAGQLVVN